MLINKYNNKMKVKLIIDFECSVLSDYSYEESPRATTKLKHIIKLDKSMQNITVRKLT